MLNSNVTGKKCDETQPGCQTCTNLGIDCEGYGPRPTWMDRGPLEREKAETVKAEIAHAGNKRRRISLSNKSSSTQPSLKSPNNDSCGPRQASGYHFEEVTLRNNHQIMPKPLLNPPLEDVQNHTDEYFGLISPYDDLWCDDMMTWQDQFLPARHDGNKSTIPPLEILSNKPPLDQRSSSSEFYLDGLQSPKPVSQSDKRRSGNLGQAIDGGEFTQLEAIELQTDSVFSAPNGLGLAHLGLDDLLSSRFDDSPNTSSLETTASHQKVNLETAILLAHYLSRVLPEQFRFSSNRNASGRQWLQVLIFSSRQLLEISLLLSRAHYACEMSPDYSKNYGADMGRAMRILRTLPSSDAVMCILDEERKAMQAVLACACFHQVLYLEVCDPGMNIFVANADPKPDSCSMAETAIGNNALPERVRISKF